MKFVKRVAPPIFSIFLGAIFFKFFFNYYSFLKLTSLLSLNIYPILSLISTVLLIIFVNLYSFNRYKNSAEDNYHIYILLNLAILIIIEFFINCAYVLYPTINLFFIYKLKYLVLLMIIGNLIANTFNLNLFVNISSLLFLTIYFLFCLTFIALIPDIYNTNIFLIGIILLEFFAFMTVNIRDFVIALKNREKDRILKIFYHIFLHLSIFLCLLFKIQDILFITIICIFFSLFFYMFIKRQVFII